MANVYKCTKCPKEFKSLKDYLDPTKHPCVKGKNPADIPKPRTE